MTKTLIANNSPHSPSSVLVAVVSATHDAPPPLTDQWSLGARAAATDQ